MATTLKTLITIWQIIRLKQLIKHWKAMSLKRKLALSDSPSSNDSNHRHILSGFFAIYVGKDRSRFLIPTRFLNLPIFLHLLKVAEEEYGFNCNEGIALPCEVEFFEEVLKFLKKDEKKYGNFEVNEFLKLIQERDFDSFSCKHSPLHHTLMPLLIKTRA